MTRKWRDYKSLVQLVRLFLIDEVHQLNDESRGPTMEAIVSRMKTIRSSLSWSEDGEGSKCKLRFIAISATMPNISDVSASMCMHSCGYLIKFNIEPSNNYFYILSPSFPPSLLLSLSPSLFFSLPRCRLLPGLAPVRMPLLWSAALMRAIVLFD